MERTATYITQPNDCRNGLDIPGLLSPFVFRALPSWKTERTKKGLVSYYDRDTLKVKRIASANLVPLVTEGHWEPEATGQTLRTSKRFRR